MGSAAWFGPHRPKYPRPRMPVRPTGFLKIKQSTKKCTKCLKVYNSSKSTLLTLMQLFIVLTTSLIIKSAGTLNIMSTASTKQFMSLQQSEKCSSLLLVKTFPQCFYADEWATGKAVDGKKLLTLFVNVSVVTQPNQEYPGCCACTCISMPILLSGGRINKTVLFCGCQCTSMSSRHTLYKEMDCQHNGSALSLHSVDQWIKQEGRQ